MHSVQTEPTTQLQRFPWLMFLFIAVVFFLYQHDLYFSTKGIEALSPSIDDLLGGAAESFRQRIILLCLGLFAVASFIRHRGVGLRINGPLGWTILFFVGWALLSLVWAEDASQTLRRLAKFGILCAAAAAVSRRCSLRGVALLTFFCTSLFLLVGVSAEIALGAFRPFSAGYRFAGTVHPNVQGINCALLLLSGLAAADTEKRRRILFRACALLGLLFLILTASRTAFAAGVLAVAVYLAAVRSWCDKRALILGLGAASCVLLLLLGNVSLPHLKTTITLGRGDPTVGSFSGRRELWEECRHYIGQHPILGYGFGGFWTERHSTEISSAQKWGVVESHSAYLECLLGLGFVGLAAYVAALVAGIARSFALYGVSRRPGFAFSGAFLTFCAVDGLLESAALLPTLLTFLAMVVLIELGFRRQEFGIRRFVTYVSPRYHRCGMHLQPGRNAS